MPLKRDRNYSPSFTRNGPPISAILSLAASDITANSWYRLCPSGNAATKTSKTELALGTLRSDVTPGDFHNWELKILNAGYRQSLVVNDIDSSGGCKFKKEIEHYDTLPASVQWVLYPDLVFPLSVMIDQRSASDADLGWLSEDTYSIANANVRLIQRLEDESHQMGVMIMTSQPDRICYRFANSGSQIIIWGESQLHSG